MITSTVFRTLPTVDKYFLHTLYHLYLNKNREVLVWQS